MGAHARRGLGKKLVDVLRALQSDTAPSSWLSDVLRWMGTFELDPLTAIRATDGDDQVGWADLPPDTLSLLSAGRHLVELHHARAAHAAQVQRADAKTRAALGPAPMSALYLRIRRLVD